MKAPKHPSPKTIGWALVQAARLHRFYLGERLEPLGLFAGQEQVIQVLAGGMPLTITELAAMLRVRLPTVSKTIPRLEAIGLVARAPGEDARRVVLTLTDRGREVAQQINTMLQDLETELARGLDPKERKRLRRGLEHLASNMVAAIGADERRIDPPEDVLSPAAASVDG